LIYPIKWDNLLLRCLFLNYFFTNFWHSGDKSDFLPILQKMQNITIIYERNACQFRLRYNVAERKILQLPDVHLPHPKNDNKIGPKCKISTECSLSQNSPECQKFVKKLFAFFSKEKAMKKPIVSFDRVYQRTSKALGVSYTSVHRIMNDKRPCKSN
jgi:hypothetical protein